MTSLSVLIVEDVDGDAALMVRALARADYSVYSERVDTAADFRAALQGRRWQLILSDYSLPGFNAETALELLKGCALDIPFIVVSNNIGEETAVALMRSGAHDYVMKASLSRLAPAVARELGDAATRAEHRRAAAALEQAETRWKRALVEMNEELERKVRERTAELSAALDHLAETKKLAALGVLVSGIAHELNTPLGNIVLGVSSLSDQIAGLSAQLAQGQLSRRGLDTQLREWRQAAEVALRNSNLAVDLIDRFKQIATDQASHGKRLVKLSNLVALCRDAAIAQRGAAEIEWRTDVDAGIELMSSPGHLEQVISGVLANAIHHGFHGRRSGRIDIGAERHGEMIDIVVADDGVGIAPELCHRVFDPFFTTKLGQGSIGLGLTIIHNLVSGVLKGTIGVRNRPEGGVEVRISFPHHRPAPR